MSLNLVSVESIKAVLHNFQNFSHPDINTMARSGLAALAQQSAVTGALVGARPAPSVDEGRTA